MNVHSFGISTGTINLLFRRVSLRMQLYDAVIGEGLIGGLSIRRGWVLGPVVPALYCMLLWLTYIVSDRLQMECLNTITKPFYC